MSGTEAEWAALRGGQPSHEDELATAHEGRPTAAEMASKKPAEDRGTDDKAKYQGAM